MTASGPPDSTPTPGGQVSSEVGKQWGISKEKGRTTGREEDRLLVIQVYSYYIDEFISLSHEYLSYSHCITRAQPIKCMQAYLPSLA